MIRQLLLITLLSFAMHPCFAWDADSSQTSSIDFIALEATLSSKIVHFKWEVKTERKGDFFIIEKSIDELNWTEVKRVKSIKDHDTQHTYELSEINFAEGVQEFFRILRVDAFGAITELDRVNINQPVLKNVLLIPVPRKINKLMTISYDSMIDAKSTLYIMNTEGKVEYQRKTDNIDGYNRLEFSIKGLKSGTYQVLVQDEFGNRVSKNLVIHGKFGKRKF